MKDTKESKKVVCSECGMELNQSDACTFEGSVFCSECLNRLTVLCERCGDRIWREDSAGDENFALCQNCYDDYYTSCTRCGRLISNSDSYYEDDESDAPYCSNCMRKIPFAWQLLLWTFVDKLPIEQDYMQVFELSEVNGLQRIIHSQECPPYKKEYLFSPIFRTVTAKIYIINDETHATMLFANEY